MTGLPEALREAAVSILAVEEKPKSGKCELSCGESGKRYLRWACDEWALRKYADLHLPLFGRITLCYDHAIEVGVI